VRSSARVTGGRVTTAADGFNPTWQRHVAAYALCAPLLGDGDPVLDLGCGVGHSFELLAPRRTVGVDVDAAALAGQERETHVADMRRLPFAERSFAAALAVQSLEHVPDGDAVLRELARVLRRGGNAVLVTPNRLTFASPDEIIDPYHYVEYDAPSLRALCERWLEGVELYGIFGSPRYLELVAQERARLDRLLARDPLRLRRLVPRRARQLLYDLMLTRARREPPPAAGEITPEDFWLGSEDLDSALDLVAIGHAPG